MCKWKKIVAVILIFCFCLLPVKNTAAEQFDVSLYNEYMDSYIYLYEGDSALLQIWDENVIFYQCYVSDANIAVVSGNEVIAVGLGIATVTVLGYDQSNNLCFQSMLTVEVGQNPDSSDDDSTINDDYTDIEDNYDEDIYPDYEEEIIPVDMTGVTLNKESVKIKATANGYAGWYWYSGTAQIKLENTPETISQWMDTVDFTYTSSNEEMWVTCSLYDNVITIDVTGTGTTTLEITINGKVFTCEVKVVPVYISSNGLVLEKGATKQLKVKNGGSSVKWTSLNKKIATVDSKGVVKAKKGGTAIIIATIGEQKFGCAVNVVSASMKKVVNNATSIAKGTYSQEKRMQKGYYDCSSLVWRSYSPIGMKFGNKNWAPVAADIGKWCAENGTKVSDALSYEDIQKKKLKVGDLLFQTGEDNGRYKGIYHVEMFIGYACESVNSEGNVYLTTKCPARGDGYGYGTLVLRPKK